MNINQKNEIGFFLLILILVFDYSFMIIVVEEGNITNTIFKRLRNKEQPIEKKKDKNTTKN